MREEAGISQPNIDSIKRKSPPCILQLFNRLEKKEELTEDLRAGLKVYLMQLGVSRWEILGYSDRYDFTFPCFMVSEDAFIKKNSMTCSEMYLHDACPYKDIDVDEEKMSAVKTLIRDNYLIEDIEDTLKPWKGRGKFFGCRYRCQRLKNNKTRGVSTIVGRPLYFAAPEKTPKKDEVSKELITEFSYKTSNRYPWAKRNREKEKHSSPSKKQKGTPWTMQTDTISS